VPTAAAPSISIRGGDVGWLIDLIPLNYSDAVVVLGAALLGITAGALGVFAVLRQRSLVGDALAHSALPGVCVAFIVTGAKDAGTLLIGAALAGFVGALFMVGIERTSRIRPDAAIGVVLSSFFSLGVVLLTYIANGDNANQAGLEKYLFGQAAGLLERDVTIMAALALGSLSLVALGFRALKTTLFDPDFAGSLGLPVRALEIAMTTLLVVAVITGLRTVGAILMVAMLVAPAVAARQLAGRLVIVLPLAAAIGAAVGVSGALLSARAEVPTGPVIVLVAVGVVIACVLFAPGGGCSGGRASSPVTAAAPSPKAFSSTSRPPSTPVPRPPQPSSRWPAAAARAPCAARCGTSTAPGCSSATALGCSSRNPGRLPRTRFSSGATCGRRGSSTAGASSCPTPGSRIPPICAAASATSTPTAFARWRRTRTRARAHERRPHDHPHCRPRGHRRGLLGPFLVLRRVALMSDAVSHAPCCPRQRRLVWLVQGPRARCR
jgi:manganese/zinc/iron transport system permease protein